MRYNVYLIRDVKCYIIHVDAVNNEVMNLARKCIHKYLYIISIDTHGMSIFVKIKYISFSFFLMTFVLRLFFNLTFFSKRKIIEGLRNIVIIFNFDWLISRSHLSDTLIRPCMLHIFLYICTHSVVNYMHFFLVSLAFSFSFLIIIVEVIYRLICSS